MTESSRKGPLALVSKNPRGQGRGGLLLREMTVQLFKQKSGFGSQRGWVELSEKLGIYRISVRISSTSERCTHAHACGVDVRSL